MELPIRLSKESREPIYHQIEGQIKALIASGQLQAGSPLPSIRALSKDLEVSVITTRRAYQDLEYQGFIETIQGKGTFVAEVDKKRKDRMKMETVLGAIEKAVETALRHDYTIEEVEQVFQQVMIRLKREDGQ
ncbi:GntR family transcriptional regulator [Robertmurraya andreesenii]|uniref:GntR family transcriptional regulator n=1 Tax=Anoxybacillus andreesenii TaxID=1325932 RepID=A0ABT9V3H8_9BACL|nr:GntR family transcriptional regulator [Robertmurraya andreesenii]MDQ0155500.1 GntR family transcriptional regulator [Robertmurraya andreesenii]